MKRDFTFKASVGFKSTSSLNPIKRYATYQKYYTQGYYYYSSTAYNIESYNQSINYYYISGYVNRTGNTITTYAFSPSQGYTYQDYATYAYQYAVSGSGTTTGYSSYIGYGYNSVAYKYGYHNTQTGYYNTRYQYTGYKSFPVNYSYTYRATDYATYAYTNSVTTSYAYYYINSRYTTYYYEPVYAYFNFDYSNI